MNKKQIRLVMFVVGAAGVWYFGGKLLRGVRDQQQRVNTMVDAIEANNERLGLDGGTSAISESFQLLAGPGAPSNALPTGDKLGSVETQPDSAFLDGALVQSWS